MSESELQEVIRVTEERARQERLEHVISAFQERLPLLLGGAIAIGAGAVLLFDDVSDFGELISLGNILPWDDRTAGVPHPHHWTLGVTLIILGVVVLAIALLLIIASLI